MMVPKSFRIQDYKARALHDAAQKKGMDDGSLLREIVDQWLVGQGYDPYDYIEPLTPPARNR